LKHAVITPLIKKPGLDPEDLANHRPIAGLSFLSKLIERVVHLQLSTHLTAFHLLPDRQSAYRTNYSTETLLLGLYNDILCNADADLTTAVCFLGLSAAFDTIDHNILLDSLTTRCGVAADVLLWFASYSSGCTQCVRVDHCLSSSVPVPVGVSQGSVNGSILFILLVSALPEQTTNDDVIIDQYLMTQMAGSPSNCSLKMTTMINGLPSQALVSGLVALMDGFSINTSSSTFPRVSSSPSKFGYELLHPSTVCRSQTPWRHI
jgi:hypothetical protein